MSLKTRETAYQKNRRSSLQGVILLQLKPPNPSGLLESGITAKCQDYEGW